ncbi:MAG: class I tRNA ligase family protein, partial [Clostridia bacterium]|nr:class I tRNA ligase family protein [Clostridia bacterium]
QGRKMSKSLGNGIDPIEVINEYGADALRYTLVTGNSPGNDMRFYYEVVKSSRNFANKIWNAARFALTYLDIDHAEIPDKLEIEDKWILTEFNTCVREVRDNLDKYELGVAAQKLYDFVWDDLCDWYIELVKPRLFETNTNEETKKSAQNILCYVINGTLALLHPFMPFITEEIWQTMPHEGEALVIAPYPEYNESLVFESDAAAMENVKSLIKNIRQLRLDMNVPASKKTSLYIETSNPEEYTRCVEFLKRLAGASEITVNAGAPAEKTATALSPDAKAYIPMGELVDIEKEKARLEKEKARLEAEIDRIDKKLANPGFVSKAPAKVVDEEKAKRQSYSSLLENTLKVLSELH